MCLSSLDTGRIINTLSSLELKPSRLNSYLDHGIETLEKAIDGELPAEEIDYLEKTAIRLVTIAVVARPTYAAPFCRLFLEIPFYIPRVTNLRLNASIL